MKIRKRNRKEFYDYNSPGLYFITICTKNRIHFFGKISDSKIQYSSIGMIAKRCWQLIPKYYHDVILHNYVVMPDHVHGIIEITPRTETTLSEAASSEAAFTGSTFTEAAFLRPLRGLVNKNFDYSKQYLSQIIHGYKSSVTKHTRRYDLNTEFGWQRSFYDVIITNEKSFLNISNYIDLNVQNWKDDKNNILN